MFFTDNSKHNLKGVGDMRTLTERRDFLHEVRHRRHRPTGTHDCARPHRIKAASRVVGLRDGHTRVPGRMGLHVLGGHPLRLSPLGYLGVTIPASCSFLLLLLFLEKPGGNIS